MSTWTCGWTKRTGGLLCLLTASVMASGCSAPNFFTKLTKKDTSAVAEDSKSRPKEIKGLKNPVQFHLTYAKWQQEMGDLTEARQSYEIALDLEPNNVDAQLGMARIEWQTGQYEASERRFEQLLATASHRPDVLDEVAQFHAENQRWTQAADLLSQATKIAPENQNYRYHYGIALAYTGDLRGAFDQLNIVVGEPEAFYNLGQILYQQGNIPAAEMHLGRALQLKPDFVEARNLIEEMRLAAGKPIRNPNSSLKQVSGTMTYEEHREQPQISPQARGQQIPVTVPATSNNGPQPFPEF